MITLANIVSVVAADRLGAKPWPEAAAGLAVVIVALVVVVLVAAPWRDK